MEVYRQEYLKKGDKLKIELSEDCKKYYLENDTGSGIITEYEVFDDVLILFDDMHMKSFGEGTTGDSLLIIEHCKEGRFEADFLDGRHFYIGAGDICVHNMDYGEICRAAMPIRHYHGITIMIYTAKDSVFKDLLKTMEININKIVDDTKKAGGVYLLRANERIEHIFDELYLVKPNNRMGYFKIKILELLLFLNTIDFDNEISKGSFLSKESAQLIEKIELFFWDNLDNDLTIKKLSERFGISQSSLKTQFKILYGCSIHKYINICRMQVAGAKLVKTNDKISQIAKDVGYLSESKFSKAFVNFYKITPRQYRKNANLSDWDIISPVRV